MWGTKIKDLPFKLAVQSGIEIWRAADFWIKEPETIAWIDSFEPGTMLWDIGANVGVFSLYAKTRPVFICPFEPEKSNFVKMLQNMTANLLVLPCYNYAVSDFDGKSTFHVRHLGPGNSGGQVESAVDEDGREFKPADSYEVETYKIDTLAKQLGVPNHIKIDVDGHEWRILRGGTDTLSNPKVKSVLVEVNNQHEDVEPFMVALGFTSFNRFNGPDINRRANKKSRNVIYLRYNS